MAVDVLAGQGWVPVNPISYQIGASSPVFRPDRTTVAPWDYNEPLPPGTIKYCNLFNENYDDQSEDERALYAPYLTGTDVSEKYGEGVIDPVGQGWDRNLREQFERAKAQAAWAVELDNADAYRLVHVLGAIALAESYGLKAAIKNPGLTYGDDDATPAVAHRAAICIIAEKGAGGPAAMAALRVQAGKPDLPTAFVFFGDGRSAADTTASVVRNGNYRNMGVTYDATKDKNGEVVEYGGDIVELVLPIASSPQPGPIMPIAQQVDGAAIVAKARSYIGKLFDGPDVVMQARAIAQVFPDLANYCAEATNTMPWCGDFVAFILKDFGIRPPTVKDRVGFFYVDRWLDWGTPVPIDQVQPGDVEIFLKNPHHVTFRAENGKSVGGNQYRPETGQSDAVTETTFRRPDAIRRPPLPGAIVVPLTPQPSPLRPMIQIRDTDANTGGAVSEAQRLLGGIDVDGEFGPDTDAAVRAFQASRGLEIDGVIGPETWAALLSGKPTAQSSSSNPLAADVVARISALVTASPLFAYNWDDRGVAPVGYLKGMAVTFAYVYAKWRAGDSSARVMAGPLGSPERDALAWYGLNVTAGPLALRTLFTMLIGLGMRESSGRYCEGRDMSASNTSADTAEAGLFQQSWNSHTASPEIDKLFAAYSATPDGFLSIFREGVTPHDGDLDNFGSGYGARFQQLCKTAPSFAVECAAVGLRVLRKHWGPINRLEVEIVTATDTLLQQVQAIVDAIPKAPEPQMPPEVFPPGQPMPGQQPQIDWNTILQQVVQAAAPALQQAAQAAIQAAMPTIIGAVQQRLGVPLQLPGTVVVQPAQTQQAAPPSSSTASTVAKNAAGGLLGIVGALLGWQNGVFSDTTAINTGLGVIAGGALNAYAPLINIGLGFVSRLAQGWKATKPAS